MCEYLGKDSKFGKFLHGSRLYFNKEQFPVPPSSVKPCSPADESLSALVQSLNQSATNDGGFVVVRNGTRDGAATLACSCHYHYRPHRSTKERKSHLLAKGKGYRKGSLHNDRRSHSRGKPGKKLRRRSQTSKSIAGQETCSFQFNIRCDGVHGYYIKIGNGCAMHKSHSRKLKTDITTSVRMLSDENKKTMRRMGKASNIRQALAPRMSTLFSLYESKHIHEIDAPSFDSITKAVDDLITEVRGKLHRHSNPVNDSGPPRWVSSNSERETLTRRTHVARNGLTEWT